MDAVRVSIGKTMAGSYRLLFNHYRYVLRIALVPTVAAVVVNYVAEFARDVISNELEWLDSFVYVSNWAVDLALLSMIGVTWHRFILMNEEEASGRPTWTDRHTRFWLWSVLLAAVTEVPLYLLDLFESEEMGVMSLPLMFVAAYFVARFSMILPATAVGHQTSWGRAWRITSHNGLRITLATWLAMVPIALPFGVAMMVMPEGIILAEFDVLGSIASLALFWPMFVAMMVLEAGALSIAYRTLTESGVEESVAVDH